MSEFDKVKKNIGAGNMDDQQRQEMFNKFISGGGKVIKEKVEQTDQNKSKSSSKNSGSSSEKSSGSSSGGTKKSFINRGTGESGDDDEKSTKTQIASLDSEMGSFSNKLIIKFKCWANGVTSFGKSDVTPKFMSELNLELKQAFLEFKISGNDILSTNFGPKITRELDKFSPLYIELIGRFHKLFDVNEMNELLQDYNSNPELPVSLSRINRQVYSIFKKLYYLYSFQSTYRKGLMTAYDILQKLENKPPIIYANRKKKINQVTSTVFDKIFEKLYLLVIRTENKNIPMISLYMENLLGVIDDERPGKRKAGEQVDEEITQQQEKTEETPKDESKPKKEDSELAYGRKLLTQLTVDSLRRKYDQRNELIEIPDTDKALLSYLFFREFDYEYSFVLTTKKIIVKPSMSNGNKIDNKQKLLSTYELSRGCMEQFKIYIDVFKEQLANKNNPGSNYIEASKKATTHEQKRGQQSRNVRMAIKEYIEKSYDSFSILIEDMKGKTEIVGNMDEVITFDSIESKKRLHKKAVKQCIMESYCYSYALSSRLIDGGDLAGGVVELSQEEMLKSFGKETAVTEDTNLGEDSNSMAS
jgi:hypothetical protein